MLLILLISLLKASIAQVTLSNYQVNYLEYPLKPVTYTQMNPCSGCDLMRCLMYCTCDPFCNAMGFDISSDSCTFLIGRVLNKSSIVSKPTMNYYEKYYPDFYLNMYRNGIVMNGFSYTPMSQMYVLESKTGLNKFSVVKIDFINDNYVRNGSLIATYTGITTLSACQTKCKAKWNCAFLEYDSNQQCIIQAFSPYNTTACPPGTTCQDVISNGVMDSPFTFTISGFNYTFYWDFEVAFLQTDGSSWTDFYYFYYL